MHMNVCVCVKQKKNETLYKSVIYIFMFWWDANNNAHFVLLPKVSNETKALYIH